MANINELKSQLQKNVEGAKALAEKASSESGLTDEDRVTLKEYREDSERIVKAIEAAKSDGEAIEAIEKMFAGIAPPDQPRKGGAVEAKSLGEQFVESEEYQAVVKGLGRGNEVPKGKRIDPVAVKGMFKSLLRTNEVGGASGGLLVRPNHLGVVDVEPSMPRIFRNLVDVQTSDSPLIEFVRREFTNNAAETPEATTTAAVDGEVTTALAGVKPESGHTFEEDSTTAKTIAHWEPLTRRMLNNVPQVRGIVEGDLRDGLEDRLENQLINGTGGTDLTGVLSTSNIGSQAFATDLFTTLLKAKTQVRIQGRRMATAHVLSPEDMEAVLLARYGDEGNGFFIYGGPAQQGPITIWGVPAIESEVLTEGTAITADWKTVKLYDVESASISWTDSHSDFFTRNIEVVRAEMDVAVAVFRPSAIVEVETAEGS